MSADREGSLNTETDGHEPGRQRPMNVRTWIVLVVCIGAIVWAWRHLAEYRDPVLSEARAIQKQAIAALKSSKPAERIAAIVELERLRVGDGSVAVPPLIGVLDDPVTEVRVAAVETLDAISVRVAKARSGGAANGEAVQALIPRLKDPEIAVRTAAFKAVGSIGARVATSRSAGETVRAAMTALTEYLKDADPSIQSAAAAALGSIGSAMAKAGSEGETVRTSARALIERLNDPEPSVRIAAVRALGKIAPPEFELKGASPAEGQTVKDVLIKTLSDRDASVRRAVYDAMVSQRGPRDDPPQELALGLKDEAPENRVAAINRLVQFRRGLDPWVPVLLQLAEHDPDRSVRERCLFALTNFVRPPAITGAAVPALVAGLKSENDNVRSHAAVALGRLGRDAEPAIPDLLRILKTPGDPKLVPSQNDQLTENADPASFAAVSLGEIAPRTPQAKEAIAALIEVVRSGPLVRHPRAIYALGLFGPAAEEAVPVLIRVFRDPTAAQAIHDDVQAQQDAIKAARAERKVISGLHSTRAHSAELAAQALGRIAPKTPRADEALAALVAVLDSDALFPREAVVEALSHFGSKAAVALPKIRALSQDNRDLVVKGAANQALRAIEKDGKPGESSVR